MALNFDAQINLDVSQFLASVKQAENAVTRLQTKLANVNSIAPKITVNAAATSQASSMAARKATADAVMQETKALKDNTDKRDSSMRSMARERYALYDVAAAYAAMSAAGIFALKELTGAAIEYERAFANVIRTTEFTSAKVGEAASVMRYELTQIASEIPLAFSKITDIATIGNQLGIAQGELASFTEAVAKFSATTGMTAEATAMGLGRTIELLSDSKTKVGYEALGSAIAYAGVKAVATEEQILSVSKEIATTAKLANFSADEVVGLATALSSVGVAPEAARGSIIRTFAGINKAVSEGGATLEAYAKISGMSASAFSSTWQQSGQKGLDAFLQGLQKLSDSGANLDTVLRNIGFKNVRDIQTVQKLGDNYAVYAESVANAGKAYGEATYLTESYGVIQDTVASKIELMKNNWDNFMATLGEESFGPTLKNLLDFINQTLIKLNEFARSPIGKFFGWLTGIVATFVVVVGSVNAVIALAKASMLAFDTAAASLGVSMGKATIGATRARVAFIALNNTLKAGLITAAISLIFEGFNAIGNALKSTQERAEELVGGFGGLQEAITADTDALYADAKAAGMSAEEYAKLNGIILTTSVATAANDEETKKAIESHNAMLYVTGQEAGAYDAASTAIGNQTLAIGANTKAWLKNAIAQSSAGLFANKEAVSALKQTAFSLDDALLAKQEGKLEGYFKRIKNKVATNLSGTGGAVPLVNLPALGAAQSELDKLQTVIGGTYDQMQLLGLGTSETDVAVKEATDSTDDYASSLDKLSKRVRTVVDYASDLNGVFSRIKNINLGSGSAFDDITSGWEDITASAEDAQKAIDKANASIKELNADKAVIKYQLAVAERYGDEKRAAVLRAKLAKVENQLTDETDGLADAQEAANKSLVGNSKAAISNRAALSGMVDKYQAYIVSLVESGIKGKALNDAIADASRKFREQAVDAGFAESEIAAYVDTINDFGTAVAKIPPNVTVTFKSDTDAATQALKEYMAKANEANKTVTTTFAANTSGAEKLALMARIQALQTWIAIGSEQLKKDNLDAYGRRTLGAGVQSAGAEIARLQTQLKGMATGGLVMGPGSGTSDSIPMRLSNGEYVMSAAAVRTYGVDFMNTLNNQQAIRSMPTGSTSITTSQPSSVVYLSPDDRALLRAAIDRPVNLFADSKKIASTADSGNVLLAQRGLN